MAGDSSPSNLRNLVNFVAPCVVVIILLISALVTIGGIRRADDLHQVAHAAATMRAELNQLAALENGAEAGEDAPEEAIVEALDQIDHNLDLALRGLSDTEAAPTRRQVMQFAEAAAFTARAYTDGRDDEADEVDDDEADPLFDQLTEHFRELENSATVRANTSSTDAERTLMIASLVAGVIIVAMMVVEGRARSRRSLARAKEELGPRYQGLIENSPIHLYIVAEDGSISFVSPSAVNDTGREITHVDELLDALDQRDRASVRDQLVDREGPFGRAETVRLEPRGRWHELRVADHRDNPAINGLVVTCNDVTDRIKLESTLRQQAREDDLTGLPNRRALHEEMGRALQASTRNPGTTVLILIDLDGFKGINDTLGHPVGDALLTSVAERLASSSRSNEMVARLGGDEFALVAELSDADPIGEAERTATRFLHTLRAPYDIEGQTLTIDASIGIAMAPESISSDTLLRYADIALYEAKKAGGSCHRMFAPEMEDLLLVQTRLQRELESALHTGEFSLHYQPLISISDGRPTGFEALMRWESPELGWVPPSTFIPAAEHSGAICPLGQWAIRQAVQQLTVWQQQFDDHELTMSVNASIVELVEVDYVEHLAQVLEETGVEPATLQIEVTESVLADDHSVVVRTLEGIRALGVRVALDDFGTGYSSMNQLQTLPIDCLKIDRTFIQSLDQDDRSSSVVHALIELGRALGLVTIAEGIETPAQLSALQSPACDLAQGYLLARPMSAEAVTEFMVAGPLPQNLGSAVD